MSLKPLLAGPRGPISGPGAVAGAAGGGEDQRGGRAMELVDYRGPGIRSRSGSNGMSSEPDVVTNPGAPWGNPAPVTPPPASQQLQAVDKSFETRYLARSKTTIKTTIQGKVYNFLERPTGWKCFIYHFTV